MLKKVLCLLLVLACSVALFACGNNDKGSADLGGQTSNGGDKNPSEGNETEDKNTDKELVADKTVDDYALEQAFFKAINDSRYNLITTKIETSNPVFEEIGPITSFYQFSLSDGENYELLYWRESLNEIGSDSMKTKFGPYVVLYEDGEYFYGKEGEELVKVLDNPDPDALDYKFELNLQHLGTYTISNDGLGGYVLSAKVSSAELESIFGVSLSADSTFDIKVEISGGSLYMINVDYVNNGNSIHIETSYTYEIK